MTLDWTHKSYKIVDIRKLQNLYALRILSNSDYDSVPQPLFVKHNIFNQICESYFFKTNWTREDIINVYWNFYITKGYFIKIADGVVDKIEQDPSKWYISFLDIDGQLGTFKNY